ncbi:hypothetical protein MVLG_03261 [Microbotryum lychnidis-dioicae p1A1 Lamole]|uniref:Nuclear pore complex protein Nup85 n=1 Tax=Microbotryum lychnidis-dioicae (strain p1A1 Lamole / MvSl-1064) TaxID=683840 RepID=U5H7N7_USTV1|nr:hypothetical protein MVLG_03261 [Microbotryum lychnidis-dioicae p1A1 Lamole]|eukprot:KDE06351.1 hypothetical protein MVLG_03261 [Microbotryum lychnidis-dioicae p1A1 Lamole]
MTSRRVQLQPPAPAHTTLQSAWNPLSPNQLVLVPTPKSGATPAASTPQPQLLYYASQGASTSAGQTASSSSSYSRNFVVSTWTLFASLQKIATQEQQNQLAIRRTNGRLAGDEPSRSKETTKYYNRISKLYRGAVVNEWNTIQDGSTSTSIQPHELALLHSTLSLTEILYLPQDGHGQGVVGEELLDWLNTLDPSPSKEQGEALADLARPWETHDQFWDYLYKSILRAHLVSAQALLNLLASHHPSAWVQRTATRAIDLVASFPRSTQHESEMGFENAFRNWRANAIRVAAKFRSGVEEELGEDDEERERWVRGFEVVFGMLQGDQEVVLDQCEDWRERVCTWGVWVDPLFKRSEVDQVLASETAFVKGEEEGGAGFRDAEEEVQYALFKGDVPRALKVVHRVSGWLAAHLSDLLDKVGVVQPPPLDGANDPDTEQTRLRDWFVIRYAEELWEADAGLWRVVVDYFGSGCGEEGRVRMGKVLRGVDIFTEPDEGKEIEGEGKGKGGDEEGNGKERLVEEVLATAAEHGLEEDVVEICKTYSEHLISLSRYGAALAFCIRSGDLKRVSRIADRILDEYLTNGQDAFVRCVDEIPVSLLRPSKGRKGRGRGRKEASMLGEEITSDEEMNDESDLDTIHQDDFDEEEEEDRPSLAPFSTRLAFLARYRDFFALYAKGERRQAAKLLCLLLSSNVAPKPIWAVLLVDSVGLLLDESEDRPIVEVEECYELMRCLEDIALPILAGNGDVDDVYGHLDALGKLMNGGKGAEMREEKRRKEVVRMGMKQLDVVRGALARCLARGVCEA